MGAITEALTKSPLAREDIPFVYCSRGTAARQDLDSGLSCICSSCAVFNEYGLAAGTPVGYYCKEGHAKL